MSWTNISFWDIALRIVFAVVVGGVIGIEREYKNRPAGMRTHVLVCLGATTIALLECLMRHEMAQQASLADISMTMGRLSAQVVSGIGFLGAGTIFMAQKKISGLTTAASLWNVACLGLMIGFGFYWVALGCCALVLVILMIMNRVIRVNAIKRVEVRFTHRMETLGYLNEFFLKNGVKILDVDFHIESKEDSPEKGHNLYTNLYTLQMPSRLNYTDIVNVLSEYPHILAVRTRST